MWQAIEQAVSAATGKPFTVRSSTSVAGGCINTAVCLRGDHRSFFVKLNRADRLPMFEAEACGLVAISDSRSVRVPQPVCHGIDKEQGWLALEWVEFGPQQATTSTLLGEQLANMHRQTAATYGWERDNTIGSTPQPNAQTTEWISFMQDKRIGFQLELARHNGAPRSLLDSGQRLLQEIPALFDNYQPAASLLHGDLWGGNWGADADGNPVIFDPAVYFGDREADLAMTGLFGGFDREFYAAYEANWPLDPGYRTRKELYNLYHILNHLNLFGSGYAQRAQDMIEQLLAALDA